MKVTHIMADGTKVENLSGKEIPESHQVYSILQEVIENIEKRRSTCQI
jgi:hypothetical protein